MRKRLLLCFSRDKATISRAINAIGARNLTLFRTKEEISFSDIESLVYDNETLNSFRSEIENTFDEVYISVSMPEISKIKIELDFFINLNVKTKYYVIGDKIATSSLEKAIAIDNKDWIKTSTNIKSINEVKLYAIIGAYNEDDIIYATVKHAFMQGCEKVFLIDNNSTDNTIKEAEAAGAIIQKVFKTKEYDELYRIRLMNDAIEEISEESKEDEIWWLWLDADEFPQASRGRTIKEFLLTTPSECRVVGAQQINHFPKDKPYYIERKHPFDFMPFAEEYKTDKLPMAHCDLKHWKHPLHKYNRDKASIRAKSGFHMAYCKEKVIEPLEHIELHHFPYREEERTKKRYGLLCNADNRNKGNDTRSPNNKSAITKRHECLENVYAQNWSKVDIDPVKTDKNSKIGIKPKKLEFMQQVWYKKETD